MSAYCDLAPGHEFHGPYHDHEYGFPVHDDDRLFERLILEINQAGLSWLTVLKKRTAFQAAFEGFDIDRVAAYGEPERTRLLSDAGIIRNRLKVDATIHNARVVQRLQAEHGSFKAWLDHHHPLPRADWVKLFKRTFRFTGPEIVNEFLMSSGYLPGAHRDDCPVQARILAAGPPWAETTPGRVGNPAADRHS
ncbi:DNA-3-methyladenine glycosylase I [Halomonas salipaludis]|uniref:DNA-3-methyladenine glycosylase n=1 Tax=Halomonas salipaludis TaxID=2032625 RepID=A0A2A2ENX1_9GAMM|nr:DNA-3-methyladenine glycosylase I [Halomonas salipaludis]PAU75141.1 DNA-3-methyladenine glycosylase [Halomonas salipaludis]